MSSLSRRRFGSGFGCCAAMVTNSGRELSDFFADAGVPSVQDDRVDSGGKTGETSPSHDGQHEGILVLRWDDCSCDETDYNNGDITDEIRTIHMDGGPQGLPLSFDFFPLLFGQLHLLLLGDDLVLVSVSDLDQDHRAHYDHQDADGCENGGHDLCSDLESRRCPQNGQDQAQHEPHTEGWGEDNPRCNAVLVPVRSQDGDSPFQAHQHLADEGAKASNSEQDLGSLHCCTTGSLQHQVLNLPGEQRRLQQCADQ